ncbi:MAG: hypothetical protein NTY69_00155 [Methylococcales bacterium]|nr:hypothetical protein [Methylococcales bacterium]
MPNDTSKEDNLVASVIFMMFIFFVMAYILHEVAESVATDIVRHNSVSILCH